MPPENNQIEEVQKNKDGKLVEFNQTTAVSFSGPIPPPAILEGYEKIVPGAAERIIKMAENQSEHRQGLERTVIGSDARNSTMGVIFGFIIGLVGLGAGAYLVKINHPVIGTVFGGGTICSLVGTFVYGTKSRRRERVEKKKQ